VPWQDIWSFRLSIPTAPGDVCRGWRIWGYILICLPIPLFCV
jgi:type_II_gspE: general secretory pathway protein E